MKKQIFFTLIVLITMPGFFGALFAEEEPVHQYKTRDEKREAANRYQLTDWLSLSAIAEIEQGQERQTPSVGKRSKHDEFSKSLDVDVFLEASDSLKAEVVLEYDDEKGGVIVDEAVATIELGKTEIELGKIYLPFGEYFSHFVTDPSLSFAETRAKGVVISHAPKEGLDLSLFAYKGDAKKSNASGHSIDWGITSEYSPGESWKLGAAYIFDLADAQEVALSDNNRYLRRVSGISAYSLYEFGDFELTAEYISALDSFQELEGDRNRPRAWNLELAHFVSKKTEWALRYAGSKELEDEPQEQFGLSGSWHISKNFSLTMEYLYSKYKTGFAEDSQEQILDKTSQLAGRLTIFF